MQREMSDQDWMDFEEDMCVFVNMYEGKSYSEACDAAREEMREIRSCSHESNRTVVRWVRSNAGVTGAEPQAERPR